MKKNLLLLLALCVWLSAEAQQTPRFRIGIESGTTVMTGKIDERWEFRLARSHYLPEYLLESENAEGTGKLQFIGLKPELSLWNDRITLASGLRYVRVNERITPFSSSNNSQLYLFLPSQQGVELYRLREMKETLGYITVPLEADLVYWKSSRWQAFLKGGIQVGMKIHGERSLDFASTEMERYEAGIFAAAGRAPSGLFSDVYSGMGLRAILEEGFHFSLTLLFPPLILTENNFSLLTPHSFGGAQITFSAPINLFSSK